MFEIMDLTITTTRLTIQEIRVDSEFESWIQSQDEIDWDSFSLDELYDWVNNYFFEQLAEVEPLRKVPLITVSDPKSCSYGTCYSRGGKTIKISLSKHYLKTKRHMIKTLVHEMAHHYVKEVIQPSIRKKVIAHGKEFFGIMGKMGYPKDHLFSNHDLYREGEKVGSGMKRLFKQGQRISLTGMEGEFLVQKVRGQEMTVISDKSRDRYTVPLHTSLVEGHDPRNANRFPKRNPSRTRA